MMDSQPRTLGRYRLVALLGEGGMGKVFRGFDSTLERNVAIKLLPAEVVGDASRLARFVQEARAASALNHPNVITVYDIGEDRFDGESEQVRYIAMELVDGKTLRDLLAGDRIELRKALKIAIQVAEGLAAAHAAGIVHRDLKPENVMITPAGFVKVLDFGLAKLRIGEGQASDSSRTVVKASEPGTVLGTVGYMSPEQAQGHPVDARSDIFSFGCVLYELASGRRAFQGDSSVDTLHKIIYAEPAPLRELRADVPPELARIVRKALAKDPDERYQSIKDIAIDLRELLREIDSNPSLASGPGVVTAPVAPLPKRNLLMPVAIALAVLAAIATAIVLARRPRTAARALDTSSMAITRITANGKVIEAALSPDGKFAGYVVSDQGSQALLVREMASGQSLTLIPARRTAYWGITFSPDSSSIYFGLKDVDNPGGSIYQISTLGGQPRLIIRVTDSQPAFSPDGRQIVFLRAGFPSRDESAVIVANSDGSAPRTLASVRAPDFFVPIFFAGASWSPDGKTIATAIVNLDRKSRAPTGRIVGIDAANGSMKTIADQKWSLVAQVAWMPDQKGLVAIARVAGTRMSQVWYVPYPSGEAQPITRDFFDYRIVSLSGDGKSLLTVAADATSDLWILRDGTPPKRVVASKAEGMYGVAPLPDGRLVATSIETGKLDLFVMNEDGSGRIQLTRDENSNRFPAVSADGKTVVFFSSTPKRSEICAVGIDGSDRRVLAATGSYTTTVDVSPSDGTVVFEGVPEGSDAQIGGFSLARVPLSGGPASQVTAESVGIPTFSPDGSKLAVMLHDPGDSRFFLATLPAAGGPATKVAEWGTSNYSLVRWAPDGKALVVNTVENDRSNLWLFPLDGSPRRKLTNFDERIIFSFAPLRDGKGWVVSRGDLSRDAVLFTGFRPPS